MRTHRVFLQRVGRGSRWVAAVPTSDHPDGFVHSLFEALGILLTGSPGTPTVAPQPGIGSEAVASDVARLGSPRFPISAHRHDPPPPSLYATGRREPRYLALEHGWADADCVRCDGTGFVGVGSAIESCDCYVDRTDYSPDLGPMPDYRGEWR